MNLFFFKVILLAWSLLWIHTWSARHKTEKETDRRRSRRRCRWGRHGRRLCSRWLSFVIPFIPVANAAICASASSSPYLFHCAASLAFLAGPLYKPPPLPPLSTKPICNLYLHRKLEQRGRESGEQQWGKRWEHGGQIGLGVARRWRRERPFHYISPYS